MDQSLLINPGTKTVKGAQSRNVSNNLMYVKSQGSNIDSFSFIRPQSMKNSQYENRQRKQKSKKGKSIKKLPFEDVKDKLFENYQFKLRFPNNGAEPKIPAQSKSIYK